MPIQTNIEPGTGFRMHIVTGGISLDDVRVTLEEAYQHPDFRPEAAAIWDLTDATVEIPTEEVRHLADFVSKLVGDTATGRVALLVSEDLEFGMARMYESILRGQSSKPIMVFRDRKEADRWLSQRD
jgi:hypothetical protein